MNKHTPGPLSVSTGTKWPFDILVTNESGGVVFKESLPCHSSMDNSFYEALHCLNFKSSEREQYAAINMRAFADAHLRAAAPEMLIALQTIASRTPHRGTVMLHEEDLILITQAIARATGEQP